MKIKQIIIILSLIIGFSAFCFNSSVLAAKCDGYDTSILPCDNTKLGANTPIEDTPLFKNLVIFINVLTGGVGVFAVGGIIYGSILYTTAGNSPEQTKKAITAIRNVVIGIIAYGLAYSLLNFLIPGGLI